MARKPRIAYVGDSMGVGTVPHLRGRARVRADVVEGRGSDDGVQALKRLLAQGDYGRVVFDLGTNDGTVKDLRRSLNRAVRLSDAPVTALTVKGPGAREKNKLLRRYARDGRIDLVRWARNSDGLLSGDGIHATSEGYGRRADMIAGALNAPAATTKGGGKRARRSPAAPAAPAASRGSLGLLQALTASGGPVEARGLLELLRDKYGR